MNKIVLILLVMSFSFIYGNLYDCIHKVEVEYQNNAYDCIEKNKTTNCCSHDYFINECLEEDPNIDCIRECIQECVKQRSKALNCCVYSPSLDICFSYLK